MPRPAHPQVNKELLQFLDRHRPPPDAQVESDPAWQLYNSTVEKFIAVEREHLALEEGLVLDRLAEVLDK